MRTPSEAQRLAAMDKRVDAVMADVLKNGDRRAANMPTMPGLGSWSGDGEIMSDFDPSGRIYANEYEYQNRENESSLLPPPNISADDLTTQRVVITGKRLDPQAEETAEDPTMQRVVVTAKRLDPQAQEDWYKYQMRASMPDFGRVAPSGSNPKVRLGNLSMKYETRMAPSEYRKAAGVVSSGKDDPGGISYGAYQLASNVGKVQNFLKNNGAPWAHQFAGMDPTEKGDFGKTWKSIAAVPTDDFFNAQHAYIEESNFDPVVEYLRKKTGLDILTQPLAVQDAVWSASVQHGGARTFLRDAINSVQVNRTAPEYSEALLSAIYEKRIEYVNAVKKMDTTTKSNLVNIRYPDELSRALQMLKK